MRVLKRDPFARMNLERFTQNTRNSPTGCAWCGTAVLRPFYYRWNPDSGPSSFWNGPYCSVSCYRAHTDDHR